MSVKKKVVIIGAGPAGLSAGYEILTKAKDFEVEIFEASNAIGGISQTIEYKDNRMDIGGHRFFSKSDRVMDFWTNIMPLQNEKLNPESVDKVMLIRSRLSRIYFLKKLFNYPLSLSVDLVKNLGFWRCVKIGFSYARAVLFPYKNVDSLEKFYINRFGRELYNLFFRDYTYKVWGIKPSEISPDWGAQRVKGLSIYKAILSALKPKPKDFKQKNIETSLIEQFLYPKFGPGQLWECVADEIIKMGGKIYKNAEIVHLDLKNNKIDCVQVKSAKNETREINADFFISTMPIKDLFVAMSNAPKNIANIATKLEYRDFITMGVLLKRIDLGQSAIKDNWIYIQEPFVRVARLQFFHNWSEYMVANSNHCFVGMEYMCFEGDWLWKMSDEEFARFGIDELKKLGFAQDNDIIDTHIARIKKAYPSYSGAYSEFGVVREFLDSVENLFVCGRNGMHRYNNMDHSMLSAFEVAKCIIESSSEKSAVWQVNAEESYHEVREKK
ncbi:NAD(P)/FAD-dependent oxidoreductase [Helicobacter sp. T3_23-1059]